MSPRSALKQAGFEKAESICDEWNWTVLGPNLRGAGNAAFTAAALIAFQDTSVSIQTRYRGDDHLMGMFVRGGKMDKPAYAYKAMRMMLHTRQRVRVTPSYGGSFAALAGLSEDGNKLSLLLADHSQRAGNLSIVIDHFGQEKQKATLALWVLDSKRDLVKIACPSVSVRPNIKLEQEFHCPTVELLQFELDAACGPVMQLTFSDANDEDGAFAIADDGTVYFAWISDRAGNTDVWMKSSRDGVNWNDPWPVVQTPVDDLMNNMVRTSDGRFHLTGRRGQCHTGQFATWDANSVDLINWSQPVQWTDLGAGGGGGESLSVRIMMHSGANDLTQHPTAWDTIADEIPVDDPCKETVSWSGDVPRLQFNAMTCWIYEGVYFALMDVYTMDRPGFFDGFHYDTRHEKDVMDFYIGASRDGVNFDKSCIHARKPLVPRGRAGSFDKDGVKPSSQIVTYNDEHWIFYGGTSERHYSGGRDLKIGLAKLRLDGFVCLHAKDKPGVVVTRPFKPQGSTLLVNVDATDGEVLVEVLNAEGSPIPGFSASEGRTYEGVDELRLMPGWKTGRDLSG